jgi:hypothetical protein
MTFSAFVFFNTVIWASLEQKLSALAMKTTKMFYQTSLQKSIQGSSL